MSCVQYNELCRPISPPRPSPPALTSSSSSLGPELAPVAALGARGGGVGVVGVEGSWLFESLVVPPPLHMLSTLPSLVHPLGCPLFSCGAEGPAQRGVCRPGSSRGIDDEGREGRASGIAPSPFTPQRAAKEHSPLSVRV